MVADNYAANLRFVIMKRILTITALLLCAMAASAQNPQKAPAKVQKANYEQASRFSAKRIGQLVYSTRIRPNWFRDSDKFWYSWKTSQGTKYYVVDPATGVKKELFDMDKLARQLTEITRDPYDAQHLTLSAPRGTGVRPFVVVLCASSDTGGISGELTEDRSTLDYWSSLENTVQASRSGA